jgi:hypothetical protein
MNMRQRRVRSWQTFPIALCEFQQRFSDDAACAAYLAAKRWPDGFRCPRCGGTKSW